LARSRDSLFYLHLSWSESISFNQNRSVARARFIEPELSIIIRRRFTQASAYPD
jgi:hypothetical protein